MTGRDVSIVRGALLVAPALLAVWLPCSAGGAVTSRTTPFKRPPYYRGDLPPAQATIVALPTVVSVPDGVSEEWLPVDALRALAQDVDRYLRDESPVPWVETAVAVGDPGGPSVAFGCGLDLVGECDEDEPRNELVVTGGTKEWKAALAAALAAAGADHAVRIEIGVAPRWIHQKGLSGKKEVRLGTDHSQALPWLTALDTPVWVVQATGVLVGPDGKVMRGGAEGIWAVRTPFKASIVGAERLITADEIETVRTSRVRPDLPGEPLVWQASAWRLVHGLTRGEER